MPGLSFSTSGPRIKSPFKKEGDIFSGGLVSDIFDVLDVPQFAATGLFDPKISVGEAVKTRYRPSQALNIKSPVARFATDVILDPLNLAFGVGLVGKGVRVAGKVAKAESLLKLGQNIGRTGKVLEPFQLAGRVARPLVKPITQLPEVKAAVKTFKQRRAISKEIFDLKQKRLLQFSEAKKGVKDSKLIQALQALSPIEKESFVPVLQRRASVVRPSKKFLSALKDYEGWIAKETRLGLNRGSLIPEQVKKRIWQPLEKVTGKSKEELAKLVKEPVYVPGIVEDRVKASDFFLPSRMTKQKPGFLKKFMGKSIGIEADPDILVERRGLAGIRHRIASDHIDEVKKIFGVSLDKSRKAVTKFGKVDPVFEEGAEKWIIDGIRYREFKPNGALRFFPLETIAGKKAVGVTKKVSSYLVPEQVFMEMNRFFGQRGGMEKLMRTTLDPATDLFRVSVLGLSPSWVFNNFFGNLTVNTLSGVGPSDYLRALRGAKVPKKLGGGLFRAEEMATALKRVLNVMEESGTLGDLAAKPIRAIMKASKPGFRLNSHIEDIFRRANYFSGKRKGLSNTAAIKNVNKWLFDYSKLLPFERRVMRKLFPFWSWTRNINVLAARLPIEHPAIVAFMRQGSQYIRDLQAEGLIAPTGDLPLHPMFAKMLGSNEKVYLNLRPTIPFNDVGNVVNIEGYLSSLNPVIKTPIERALRLKFYGRKPFSAPYKDIDEGRTLEPLPPLWRHIASISPQFRVIEDLLNPVVRYDVGLPMLKKGKPIEKARGITALGFLGPKVRVEAQVEAELKRKGEIETPEAEREKAREEKYEKQLKTYRTYGRGPKLSPTPQLTF